MVPCLMEMLTCPAVGVTVGLWGSIRMVAESAGFTIITPKGGGAEPPPAIAAEIGSRSSNARTLRSAATRLIAFPPVAGAWLNSIWAGAPLIELKTCKDDEDSDLRPADPDGASR